MTSRPHSRPLAVDLFCGLGGWSDGLLAEGYRVVGFDIERHAYGEHRYPGDLVLQDVRTLHGSQFRDAALIVASPPCTEYSYMAMPWRRAKQIARALRGEDEFPENYTGSRTTTELTALFDACFRIQREASAAAGRHVPMVVENVRGAQDWVGRARWRYGSFYLWGDVPALMPIAGKAVKVGGLDWSRHGEPGYRDQHGKCFLDSAIKNEGGSWFRVAHNTTSGKGRNPDGRPLHRSDETGKKIGGDWFSDPTSTCRRHGSKSAGRRMASAMIAKIPLRLARHVAEAYR